MTWRRVVAVFVVLAAGSLGPLSAATTASRTGTVVYWRSLWHHATMYIGSAGRPVLDPEGAVYAIGRDVDEEFWVSRAHGARVSYSHDSAPYLLSLIHI